MFLHILSIIIQSWLLLWIAFQGASKIAGTKQQVELFQSIRWPQQLRIIAGVVQLIGAAALIAGYWAPAAAAWAGIWLGVTMLVAIAAHIRVKHSAGQLAPALVTLVLALAVVILFADELL
ncbi:DoxX family protein [Paenibacillus sp. PL2-23]|uniref:DoxX family protein n=1 Tax=Paenibacillus sp. PL2-23 TaxID=2100729 RepID=UPI0030FBCF7D